VERSPKNNLILTVNPTTISAEGLLAKRALWEKALEGFLVSTILLPTSWVKLVAHGVSIRAFEEIGLKAFPEEAATFNPIRVIGEPR
jgi:hypothetical protein